MEPIPENPVNTTNDSNQQSGGAGPGAAAVPYAVIQDVEQVARRRICVVANAMSAVEYRDVAAIMTMTKNTISSVDIGPGEMLTVGGGTAGIWTVKVPGFDALPTGLDNDFTEVGLSLSGARSGIELRGGWADSVSVAALVVEAVAAHVVYNRAHGTAYKVVVEPDGSRFDATALKGALVKVLA